MIDSLYETFRLTEKMVTVKARKESRDDAPACAIAMDRERFQATGVSDTAHIAGCNGGYATDN
jgi:hypothetical protein